MSRIEVRKFGTEGLPREIKFDADWYAATYNLDAGKGHDYLLAHYQTVGTRAGYQPSPYFLPSHVRKQMERGNIEPSGNLQKDFLTNYDRLDPHFMLPRAPVGFIPGQSLKEGIDSEWYNISVYILRKLDSQGIRHNLFFDPGFVLDASGKPADRPLEYYFRHLSTTEHQTSVLFDPEFYEASYPDVKRVTGKTGKYVNLFHHFIQDGIYENRMPFADFDSDFYLSTNPDLKDSIARGEFTPIQHFLYFGIRENRCPNQYFDVKYYLDTQPDVSESVWRNKLSGPFEHFLKFGYKAGYKVRQPLYSVSIPDHVGKALYEKRCEVAVANLRRSNTPITFPEPGDAPELSCIIPVIDQGSMTIHLLQQLSGIAWRRDMPSMEVIIVDNGSTDVTRDLGALTKGVRILRSETPLGYPKACNQGAAAARGKVLLFMNNDIEVAADSFRAGLSRLAEDPAIGAVGGRIILMNGQLQEAGSYLNEDGGVQGYGRSDDPTLPRYNIARTVDYCSGCFMFVRREDFETVGGFAEAFSPGYYEEAELCLRLRARGLATLFDPAIHIYHYEYASYSKGRPPSTSAALMRRNRRELLSRHRQALAQAPQIGSPDWHRQLLRSRYDASRSIAVVEDMIPDRSIGSGFVRTVDLIDSFLKGGHRVTLFALQYKPGLNAERLRQRGVEVVPCYGPTARPDPLDGREWDFDVVWICRTHNIFEWSQRLRRAKVRNPSLRAVFDTEAIASLRTMAYWRLHDMPPPETLETLLAKEFDLDSAILPDAVVAVNQTDRKAVETLSIAPVFTLGFKMDAKETPAGLEGRSGLFFCGGFHEIDSPNYDSMEWFLGEVWPLVRARKPDATLTISGYCAAEVPLRQLVEQSPGVDYVGRVDSVVPFMERARCFIAPTRFAGGIPHKVYEAMAAGLPVVCTDILRDQIATDALGPDQVPVLSAGIHTPAAFADACCAMLEDDASWVKQQQRGLDFVRETASGTVFDDALEKILDAL